jgi:hypothetical protein
MRRVLQWSPKIAAVALAVALSTALIVPQTTRAVTCPVTGTAIGSYCVVFITSGSGTWSVPSDWDSSNNKIEVIGGGGGGASVANNAGPGCGGGYSMITNVALSGSISYTVGAGGAADNSGGDTWFNSASFPSSGTAVGAKGGTGGSILGVGCLGGSASNGYASGGSSNVKYSGGNAGFNGSNAACPASGAAGPNGNGAAPPDTAHGGQGGNGSGGIGGTAASKNGANGTEWDATHGSGGGGYGTVSISGGNGGQYGGGGGCSHGAGTTGGSGGSGLIVISYVPVAAAFTHTSITLSDAVSVKGIASVIGALSKGSGTFVIDHPLDPKNKLLYHSFVESPDVMNVYDGIATLDKKGEATVTLPDYFFALNKDFKYLATAIGSPMPDLFLSSGVTRSFLGLFGKPVIRISGGAPNGRVSWQVTGVRHDPFIRDNPIIPEVEKGPDELADKGEYLFPEYYVK